MSTPDDELVSADFADPAEEEREQLRELADYLTWRTDLRPSPELALAFATILDHELRAAPNASEDAMLLKLYAVRPDLSDHQGREVVSVFRTERNNQQQRTAEFEAKVRAAADTVPAAEQRRQAEAKPKGWFSRLVDQWAEKRGERVLEGLERAARQMDQAHSAGTSHAEYELTKIATATAGNRRARQRIRDDLLAAEAIIDRAMTGDPQRRRAILTQALQSATAARQAALRSGARDFGHPEWAAAAAAETWYQATIEHLNGSLDAGTMRRIIGLVSALK